MYASTSLRWFLPTVPTPTLRLNAVASPAFRRACCKRPLTRAAKNTGETLGRTLKVNWINWEDQFCSSLRRPSFSQAACKVSQKAAGGGLGNSPDEGQPDQV